MLHCDSCNDKYVVLIMVMAKKRPLAASKAVLSYDIDSEEAYWCKILIIQED